jgi:hypothetical protein
MTESELKKKRNGWTEDNAVAEWRFASISLCTYVRTYACMYVRTVQYLGAFRIRAREVPCTYA